MFRSKILLIVMAVMTSAITMQANAVETGAAKTQLLIDKFKEICGHTPLDLDSLSAKAATMKLRPLEPPASFLPVDKSVKQKTWSVAEEEGLVLVVQEDSDTVTCAVAGIILDFDVLHSEFLKETDSRPTPAELVSENKKLYTGQYPTPYTAIQIFGIKGPNGWVSKNCLSAQKTEIDID